MATKETKKQCKLCLLLIFILLIGTFLRFYNHSNDGLWVDELLTFEYSRGNLKDTMHYLNNDHSYPPLYFLITKIPMQLFGYTEFAVRFSSILFGILSIYVFYLIGSILFGSRTGLLAALLLSTSAFHI